jgi:hypothetical protein
LPFLIPILLLGQLGSERVPCCENENGVEVTEKYFKNHLLNKVTV